MHCFKRVFIAGGGGYVGSALVPSLLESGYQVVVYDLFIYGKGVLEPHPNLLLVEGDIRDTENMAKYAVGSDVVIHLACISNDPSFELNPSLGREINLNCFEPFVSDCRRIGISRFIYASSSSVYGVKSEKNVTEDMKLEPLTDYSLFKAECEKILLRHRADDFTPVIVRPATVCGYAPRQRLDVVVNIFSNLAFHKRQVSVFGGSQLRPNINIKDMVRVYELLLDAPESVIAGEIFNAGYENHSVMELAKMSQTVFGEDVELVTRETDDNRSYHVSSEKISEFLGFTPEYSIEDAMASLRDAFSEGLLLEPLSNEMYYNIKRMKSINLE